MLLRDHPLMQYHGFATGRQLGLGQAAPKIATPEEKSESYGK
jgi:hypothetical protein